MVGAHVNVTIQQQKGDKRGRTFAIRAHLRHEGLLVHQEHGRGGHPKGTVAHHINIYLLDEKEKKRKRK
jgi:hypothetical protein